MKLAPVLKLVLVVVGGLLIAAAAVFAAPIHAQSPTGTSTATRTPSVTPTGRIITATPSVTGTFPVTATVVLSPTLVPTPVLPDPEIEALIMNALTKTLALDNYRGIIKFQVGQALVENWNGNLDGGDAQYTHFSDWYSEDVEIIRKDGKHFERAYGGGDYGLWREIPAAEVEEDYFHVPTEMLASLIVEPGAYRKVETVAIEGMQCDGYSHNVIAPAGEALYREAAELRFPLTDQATGGLSKTAAYVVLCPDGYVHMAGIEFMPTQYLGPGYLVVLMTEANKAPAISAPAIVTPTPTRTATPVRTATPTLAPAQATATRTAGDAMLKQAEQWPIVLTDWDEENLHDWQEGRYAFDVTQYDFRIDGNKYIWEAHTTDSYVTRTSINTIEPKDFYATVNVRRRSGPIDAGYGLAFRVNGDDYYEFWVADGVGSFPGGVVSLYRNQAGEWDELIGYQDTDAVRMGEVNKLGVLSEGDRITLFINDEPVGSVRDDKLTGGGIGVFSRLLDPGDAAFEFSDLVVRVPPEDVAPTPSAAEAAAKAQAAQDARADALAWGIVAQDDFSTNENNWPLEDTTEEYGPVTGEVADGKYRWTMDTIQDTFYYELAPEFPVVDDFYATVQGEMVSGPERHFYGMVLRAEDGNFYLYRLRNKRYVSVLKIADKRATLVREIEVSDRVKDGANTLGVLARGDHFDLFLNDVWVGEFEDDELGEGQVGVAYGTDTLDPAVFEFDNIEIRAP